MAEQLFDAPSPPPVLDDLNDAQRAAVRSTAPVLRILAGAGSGKTRVLTRRIAHRANSGEVDPQRVLAVTFTRKAGAELRDRLGSLGMAGVTAGTFHAIAFAQLRQRWEERGIRPPELLDRKVGFVARIMGRSSSTAPLDVVSEIEWAKARMISAADYQRAATAARRTPGVSFDLVASTYAAYEERKLDQRKVDFDDLLRLATRDLLADDRYAAARRWRHRHLFVDEFQDVNPLQFELLRAWVGDTPDLCVVGDPNQAIYAWNGADAGYLVHLSDHFGSVETVELTENYRSTPQILGLANTVLGRSGASDFLLRPTRGDGPVPTLRAFEDDAAEAAGVARAIRDRRGPDGRWNDHAVLVRTNAQLVALAEACTAAQIPTRSKGALQLLDQPEIKDALRTMRTTSGPFSAAVDELDRMLDDHRASLRSSSSSEDGIGDEMSDELTAGPSTDAPAPTTAGAPGGLSPERLANISELVRLGREFLAMDTTGDVARFVAWIRASLYADAVDSTADAVTLATFHAAKGLEWDHVHIAGLEEGFVPIHHATSDEALAEEVRLLYVALTRPRRSCHLSHARRRQFGSKTVRRRPSPQLATIELALELMADREASIDDLPQRIAAARRELAQAATRAPARRGRGSGPRPKEPELSDADAELFEQLRSWRLVQSRVADVPAYVICSDATLRSIARERPADMSGLLTISGVGPVKAERFGEDLLALVASAETPT